MGPSVFSHSECNFLEHEEEKVVEEKNLARFYNDYRLWSAVRRPESPPKQPDMITFLKSIVTCLQHADHKFMAENKYFILMNLEPSNKLTNHCIHRMVLHLTETRKSLPQSQYVSPALQFKLIRTYYLLPDKKSANYNFFIITLDCDLVCRNSTFARNYT